MSRRAAEPSVYVCVGSYTRRSVRLFDRPPARWSVSVSFSHPFVRLYRCMPKDERERWRSVGYLTD